MTALPSTEDLARLAAISAKLRSQDPIPSRSEIAAEIDAIREGLDRREADERQRNALALALDALVDAKKDWWREAAPQWNMADFLEWATVRKMTVAISAIRAATPTTEASHGNLMRRFGSRGVDAPFGRMM